MRDSHVGSGGGHRQHGSRSGDLASGAGKPRVEAADTEDAIAVAEAADAGPRRQALTRRAEVGVDPDQAGNADEQRPGGGRHLHLDVRRRLELDDAAEPIPFPRSSWSTPTFSCSRSRVSLIS